MYTILLNQKKCKRNDCYIVITFITYYIPITILTFVHYNWKYNIYIVDTISPYKSYVSKLRKID